MARLDAAKRKYTGQFLPHCVFISSSSVKVRFRWTTPVVVQELSLTLQNHLSPWRHLVFVKLLVTKSWKLCHVVIAIVQSREFEALVGCVIFRASPESLNRRFVLILSRRCLRLLALHGSSRCFLSWAIRCLRLTLPVLLLHHRLLHVFVLHCYLKVTVVVLLGLIEFSWWKTLVTTLNLALVIFLALRLFFGVRVITVSLFFFGDFFKIIAIFRLLWLLFI